MRLPEPPTRVYTDQVADSSRWSAFVPRAGDIVVSTPPKCGTTWTQAIIAMLITGNPGMDAETSARSPWIDSKFREIGTVIARLEAQTHRRQVKTHSPCDAIPIWPDMRYVMVYRHPIDVYFSFRKHVSNMNPEIVDLSVPDDPSEGFAAFLARTKDHLCLPIIVDHYRSVLDREPRENFLRLHYRDMLRDLTQTVDQIADHLDLRQPPEIMSAIVTATSFASMKANADRFAPSAGQGLWKNDAGFFDSASSNKWEGQLTKADLADYDARMTELMSPQEREWLEWGSQPDLARRQDS